MQLEMKELTREFQKFTAVNQINLTFTNGVYGLLGVNGAGKTTLMRMICTLLPPSSGSILLDGKDIFQMGAEYRKILGYLPQDFGFYPEFSIEDYLEYIAAIKGLRPAAAKEKTEKLLHQVGLWEARKKKMKKLSGGMKRRAGIAQALLNDPKILVLDEPTAGLDPNERVRFRNLISELSKDRIVLLSTHIVSDIEYIAKEILLMKDGSIKAIGTAEEITASMPCSVWECRADRSEVTRYTEKYKVANIKTLGDGVELRILSEEAPVENAVKVSATMEDVFLYFFGEAVQDGANVGECTERDRK